MKDSENQLISAREELSSTQAELSSAKEELAKMKAGLASVKVKLRETAATQKTSKSDLRRAATRGASTALGVVCIHHPDLDYDQIKTGMKCTSVNKATALCQQFGPLAADFVKMANIVSDSSSSEAED